MQSQSERLQEFCLEICKEYLGELVDGDLEYAKRLDGTWSYDVREVVTYQDGPERSDGGVGSGSSNIQIVKRV